MPKNPLFKLGQVVATPGALDLLETQGLTPLEFLGRHMVGDWGNIPAEDVAENNLSLREGFRLLSAYDTPGGKLWVITEADRSVTTLLLPDEY